jgi:rod shape-determining protein MreC
MARPRTNRRRFVLVLVILTSLTLITLDSRNGRSGPLGAVGRVAHTVVSPVQHATSAVANPIGDWWSGLVDSGRLKKENRKLRAEVAKLRGREDKARIAIENDNELRRFLGLDLLESADTILARVVDRNPGNFESTIVINRGQEHGIQKDMAVIAPDGVVGHVIESWHGGAKVRLLTDPESAVAVRTVEHPATGIAQGSSHSDDLTVSDFDAKAIVARGDHVITADVSNSVFPPDLEVGRVTSIKPQDAGLGLTVKIKPAVDFNELDYVEVLRWVPGEGPVVAPPTTTTTTTTVPGATTTTTTTTTTVP